MHCVKADVVWGCLLNDVHSKMHMLNMLNTDSKSKEHKMKAITADQLPYRVLWYPWDFIKTLKIDAQENNIGFQL